jgi:hypothetical protein
MKTTPRTLVQTSAGMLVAAIFAAAAVAGPGPQYWQQMDSFRTDKAAKQKTEPRPAAAKCEGCKSTPIWVANDRAPAGKGAPSVRAGGSEHSCSRCAGNVATQSGKVKDGMTRAAPCTAMACCK